MYLPAHQGALHPALSSLQLVHIALAHGSPALLSAFGHRPGSCASCPPPLLPWHPAATQPRDTHRWSLVSLHLVTATKPQLSPPMALLHPQPLTTAFVTTQCSLSHSGQAADTGIGQNWMEDESSRHKPAGTCSRQAAAAWASTPWPVGSLQEKPVQDPEMPTMAPGASCSALPVPWQ